MRIIVAIAEYYLVFLELRFFSSIFPSIPKGEISSMNVDVIPLWEYPKHWIDG